MSMIKLDTVEWSLYESTPISYDEFIRSYGKLNTQQVYLNAITYYMLLTIT